MKIFFYSLLVVFFSACASNTQSFKSDVGTSSTQQLKTILAAQDDEHKQRHQYRHPQETIEFFGLQPGMTVVEILPGAGWYSKILVPYLGKEGKLIGIDYDTSMWPNFDFGTPEFIEARAGKLVKWESDAIGWGLGDGAQSKAYPFENAPALTGQVDSVLFVRALHNLARFESKGSYLTRMLSATYAMLKPGGTVGVVQHQAAESMDDSWADGSRGYLKDSFVKAIMSQAGFEFLAESEFNRNVKDIPKEDEFVWRLPPNFVTSKNDEGLKEKFLSIGESNRSTLLFRKPL